MRTFVLTLLAGIAAGTPAWGEDKKDPPLVGAMLVSADGFEVGKELARNSQDARKHFTPQRAPKGVLGGSVVNIHGVVGYTTKGGLYLASGNEWMLKVEGEVTGKGPYVSIGVESVSLASDGSKFALIKGSVALSEKPFGGK